MELLKKHFDAALDTPDGIIKLKELILVLAIKGLMTSRTSKKVANTPSTQANLLQSHSVIANSDWKLCTLGDLFSFEYGKSLPAKARSNTGEFPVYGSNGIVGTHHTPLIDKQCIVIGRKGSAGALHLSLSTGCFVTDVAYYCTPPQDVHLEFAYWLLKSLKLEKLSKGIKPGLNRNEAYQLPIALPPLKEQIKIVTRIKDLMARCDELEQLRAQRDKKRINVNSVAIKELLSSKDSSSFDHSWSFIRCNFNDLYSTKENVDELKKAILQLAVMGKLVPQDSSDEPASALLGRIEAKKQLLIKEKKIKKQKKLPAVSDQECIFSIPKGWEWSRLGQLAELIGGFAYKSPTFQSTGNIQVLRLGNVKQDNILLSAKPVYIDQNLAQETSAFCLKPNDVIISMTGTRAKRDYLYTARVTENPHQGTLMHINQRVGAIRAFFDSQYLAIALKVENLKTPIFATATGSANQANVGITALNNWVLPIPPLNEQKRIVRKVNQLLSLCDEVGLCLENIPTIQTKLLNTLMEKV